MPRRKSPLQVRIDALTEQLRGMREEAMRHAGYRSFDNKKVASFHGRIGSKNNEYVDAIRDVFLTPEQFISEWKAGALRLAAERDAAEEAKYGQRYQNSAIHRILRYLKDPVIRQYMEVFFERNFYNEYLARVREKPEDALWEVWFGSKNQEYGLFITPRFAEDQWENDVSHIRRVEFDYWTIGHVLTTGFIVGGTDEIYPIHSLQDLLTFYKYVLVRAQGSPYGTAFAEQYVEFVENHPHPETIPFLIPEFRYEGTGTGEHLHRLDFTILSASRRLKIGIELSPWSTHGTVKDKKKLKEKGGEEAIETERIRLWEKEAGKRNAYFLKLGITTLTFTDSELADIPGAFEKVRPYLAPPADGGASIPEVNSVLDAYTFDTVEELEEED